MANKAAQLNEEPFDDKYLDMALLPLLQYHTNYMLKEEDYYNIHREQLYHLKGYMPASTIVATDASLEEVVNAQMQESKTETASLDEDSDDALNLRDNRACLEQILELCREKGSKLLLMKVPVHMTPEEYSSYWSYHKHLLIQALADELGVEFLDLNYEDTGLDWQCDSYDGGCHLNLSGATKVSRVLAEWLKQHYSFDAGDSKLKAQWDAQLALYDWEMKFYWLRMEKDIPDYIDMVNAERYTVLASVSGDVSQFWTDEMQATFTALTGCDLDLRDPENAALCVVSRGGEIIELANDPEKCDLSGAFEDGTAYRLSSNPGSENTPVSIRVDHTSVSSKQPGMHLTIYDEELGFSVDSRTIMLEPEEDEEEDTDVDRERNMVLYRSGFPTRKYRIKCANYMYEKMKTI